MKRFFKYIACAAFMTIAATSFAQTTEGAAGRKDKAAEATRVLTTELSLTSEQQTTVKTMADKYYADLNLLKRDKETFDAKKKELDAQYEAELRKIFTEEQIVKFDALKAKMKK